LHLSRALGTLASAIVLATGAVLGCQLLLPTIADDSVPDAGTSTESGPPIDTCDHASPPAKPDASRGTRNFRLAVQSFGVSSADAAPDLGYDLDGICTCREGATGSCRPLVRDAAPACDDPNGRDRSGNQDFGDLLGQVFATTNQGDVNARIANGHLGYLFEILGSNGASDAHEVTVRFYNLSRLPVANGDGGIDDKPPAWDGKDLWALDCALSLVGNCPGPQPAYLDAGGVGIVPSIFDTKAYVVDRKLVARLDAMVLGLGVAVMRLQDVVITATVTELDGGAGLRLDGQIAGRFPLRDVLDTLSFFESPNGGYFCGEDEIFKRSILPKICAKADIASRGKNDHTNAPCDALSVAIPFVALPADMAYRWDETPRKQGCDGGVDGIVACSAL
jgi:hypothetical protein